MRHWAEEVARGYLQARGFQLLAENYTARGGEIDLVMRDGQELVFVEVRQRRSSRFGAAAETIDARKLARMRRAAREYLARHFTGECPPLRLDAVLMHGSRDRHRIEHLTGIG